ncbi:uncharacterized protein LOC106152927 isoform X1 [Lingula anatina]|uniref:Uncharacterized protein LOC106152927 isoform X1 n=1 Tax=Lingula anatina TaxID=7574 RepID=A0A1S3H7N2_LINAN|nr:uncharacterized protein LOC106152927 isoform X1 [Lingula anatina]|eukprot:XP_013382125.1 uncharacterized protein LOC106152927 isoform X1 [Lingula anatina]
MGEKGTLCCGCCVLLSIVALAVCGLTFGILCLKAEDRLENKVRVLVWCWLPPQYMTYFSNGNDRRACQGVVTDAAAITLIVFGGLATLLCCCCCCYACLSRDETSQETSSPVEAAPPDYNATQWSSSSYLTAPTHTVIRQIHVIRHVTIGRLSLRNINNE